MLIFKKKKIGKRTSVMNFSNNKRYKNNKTININHNVPGGMGTPLLGRYQFVWDISGITQSLVKKGVIL